MPIGTERAETKSLLEDVLEAINITEDVRMTASPSFPASVASEELPTMKESASASVTSQGRTVSKAPTKGAKAVSPSQSRKRKKKEPASQVVEPSSASVSSDEQVSVEPSEIVATEGSKNETMSPGGLLADPNPESVTSGEEASEDPFRIGDTKDVQD